MRLLAVGIAAIAIALAGCGGSSTNLKQHRGRTPLTIRGPRSRTTHFAVASIYGRSAPGATVVGPYSRSGVNSSMATETGAWVISVDLRDGVNRIRLRATAPGREPSNATIRIFKPSAAAERAAVAKRRRALARYRAHLRAPELARRRRKAAAHRDLERLVQKDLAPKYFSGNGLRRLPELNVLKTSVLSWTNDGPLFQVFARHGGGVLVNSQGHRGETIIDADVYDLEINALGNWRMAIRP